MVDVGDDVAVPKDLDTRILAMRGIGIAKVEIKAVLDSGIAVTTDPGKLLNVMACTNRAC